MEEFLSTIRSASLFSGVSETELTAMLACLKAEKKTSRRKPLYCGPGTRRNPLALC